MDNTLNPEIKQKAIENLILLVLGSVDKEMSQLHLQKEVFLLWNFHPSIKKYIGFIKHFRGPFSREIQASIFSPLYLENDWEYNNPSKNDEYSGGHIRLTKKGKEDYSKLINSIRESSKETKDPDLLQLLSGIKLVRMLYDKLSSEELLLLIYYTYPEYIQKSEVFNQINSDRIRIFTKLFKNGVIDKDRFDDLLSTEVFL